MCGRVIRTTPVDVLEQLFGLTSHPAELRDRWNLAPTDPIPVVRTPHVLEVVRWGLEMPDRRHTGINAKSENLLRRYGDALRDRRCVVLVDAFYEWRTIGRQKYPFLIHRQDGFPMPMAGIHDGQGCAIITKPAQGVVAELHARMPVLLERDQLDPWLLGTMHDASAMMDAANANGLTMFPVSQRVNSVKNDDPSLIVRVTEPAEQRSLF